MSEQFFKLEQVYPWQMTVWKNLTTRFPNIAHGLLFFGKKGCGKQDFTHHLVAWILCHEPSAFRACGSCNSCLWLKSGTHPNYMHITLDDDKKSNKQIKIEKIRDLQPFVQQTVDGWRVIVIDPAHALNTASANALLKTLEEPGERVVIILLTEHFLKLPATIRSRLQRYPLDRLTDEQAQSFLVEHQITPDKIPLSLNLANGMPLEAIALQAQTWIDQRQEFLNDWISLVKYKEAPLKFSTKWNKAVSFVDFQILLEYLLTDLICIKLNQAIKNIDLDFSDLCAQYTLEQLFEIHQQLQQFKRYAKQNVQTNLMIDQIFTLIMNVT